jgi:DNA-directed RNA polymerase subunit RPC12/RpoP
MTDVGWCAGSAECLSCEHKWIAVWPLGGDDLACPECGSMDTVREHDPSYVRG